MSLYSLWHLFIVVFFLATALVGIWAWVRVLRNTGFSGWWGLVGLIPVVNLVMLWVFAYAAWPRLDHAAKTAS